MKGDFLGEILGNKARAQVLRVFVLNPNEVITLVNAARRSGVSLPVTKKEIRGLEKIGILKRSRSITITLPKSKRVVRGQNKIPAWAVNADFRHLRAVTAFVHEVSPVRYDNIVGALKKSGKVSAIILSGTFMGDDSRPADLVVASDTLNERRLEAAIKRLEPAFGREIRYAAFSTPEFRYRLTIQDRLIRDTLDFPHLVLLDRTRLL
ncbi:hypothetical protein HY970_01620 [Candidatus Kaiserbacteria bacterium]|nr:hypothetical protein [Candidatus Kaiserbacteria bacterium]